MNIKEKFEERRKQSADVRKLRILAFGSSNTERRIPGTHWLDCLELAIKNAYGRIHRMINSGTGSESSRDLLARFEDDAGSYKPNMAFITIGGNDPIPELNLNEAKFEENLLELHRKFDEIGCFVIFQTYYAPIPEQVDQEHYAAFLRYMEVVRRVAKSADAGFIDHLAYWTPFRERMPNEHLKLMMDAFHVNQLGNLVLGLHVVRHFGLELDDPFFDEAKRRLALFDSCRS